MNNINEKIKNAYQFMQDFVPLNEASLSHILKKEKYDEGYVIISACRHDWDEENKQENRHINNVKTKELAHKIKDAGFGYIRVFGGFKENFKTEKEHDVFEKSFMIFPFSQNGEPRDYEELKDFAFEMGKEYNQDSVLIKEPTIDGDVKAPYYLVTANRNGDKIGDKQEWFGKDTYKVNDISREFFTAMRKRSKKYSEEEDNTRRFTLVECYVANDPKCYSGAHSRWASGEMFNYLP